jgi:crotonobetainyl-CoA:carnitine CoA-transferase CaiB-like acyl-CoA transferase
MTDAEHEAFRPLTGVRVIDFTRLLAGPYATMTLAELGAEVIKVEQPGIGDETRHWGPPFVHGASAYFHAINRGKRSIALDLADHDDLRVAHRLIGSADVLVESFRPGVADRLGVGTTAMRSRFPRLVYASISGYSPHGPLSAEPGTAVTVEAESGLMHVTGYEGADPVRSGVAMVDIATGMSMINGVLAALLERERTGLGRRLEFSLFATAISSLGTLIAAASAGGPPSRPWGSGHPSIVPYRAFAALDGHVVLGATNDAMFVRLVDALDLGEELGDARWARNEHRVARRSQLEGILAAKVGAFTVDVVIDRLRAARVLASRVRSPEDAAAGPQARALRLIEEDDGLRIARSALGTNGTRRLPRAPQLDADGEQLRAEVTAAHEEGTDVT